MNYDVKQLISNYGQNVIDAELYDLKTEPINIDYDSRNTSTSEPNKKEVEYKIRIDAHESLCNYDIVEAI